MDFTLEQLFILPSAERAEYRERGPGEKHAVHWGERKSLLSIISFISLFWTPTNLPAPRVTIPSPRVLFVGQAGANIEIAAKMFPNFQWQVYATNRTALINTSQVTVHGRLTTDIVKALKGNIDIFICDYRSTGYEKMERSQFENIIMNDLLLQQEWYKILQPKLAQLKFRLPYPTTAMHSYNYLDGYILKQIWAPASSTETTLIVTRDFIREYDLTWYEQVMAAQNQKFRESVLYKNPLLQSNDALSLQPIAPKDLTNDFDSAAEVFVLAGYLRLHRRSYTSEQVLTLSKWLTNELNAGWSSLLTDLWELREITGHSTVIRQKMLRNPTTAKQLNPRYQKKTRGIFAATTEEEAKVEEVAE